MNSFGQFMIHEVPDEMYPIDDPQGFSYQCLAYSSNPDRLYACFEGGKEVLVISRSSKAIITSVENPNKPKFYNSLQSLLSLDDASTPSKHLICKDERGLLLIDTAAVDSGESESKSAIRILDVPFENVYCSDYSLLQYIAEDPTTHERKLRIVTISNKFDAEDGFEASHRMLVELEL